MKLLNSKQGTTMVEVLAAFSVLVMIMGFFSQALAISGNIVVRSEEQINGQRLLAKNYYLEEINASVNETTLIFQGINGNDRAFAVDACVRTFVPDSNNPQHGSGTLVDVVKERGDGGWSGDRQ